MYSSSSCFVRVLPGCTGFSEALLGRHRFRPLMRLTSIHFGRSLRRFDTIEAAGKKRKKKRKEKEKKIKKTS